MNKGRRKMSLKGKILAVLFAVIVLVVALFLLAYSLGRGKIVKSSAAPATNVSQEEIDAIRESLSFNKTLNWQDDWIAYDGKVFEYKKDVVNILLLGIDKTGTLSSETDLSDWSAGQADTIFVVSFDPDTTNINIVAIPKHAMTYVEMFDENKQSKGFIYNQICLQYGFAGGGEFGLEMMKNAVSEMLGNIPIQGACAIDFDAIGTITQMIGGVEVTVNEDLSILGPEFQIGNKVVISGDNTVNYLIYRDTSVIGSPTSRLSREKEFLKAMVPVATQAVKKNPMLIANIYNKITPYMNTDIELTEAVYLCSTYLNYRLDDDSIRQLIGNDVENFTEDDDGTIHNYNDFYLDDEFRQKTIVDTFYRQVVLTN